MFSYFKQAPTFFMGLLHGSEHGGLNQLISKEAVERLLRKLEKDPATVIKHWGLLTLYGKCLLTHPEPFNPDTFPGNTEPAVAQIEKGSPD
jgi:hypothetical protein